MTEIDPAGMDARMDEIRLKQILGSKLTEQELMCIQIEENGFGCTSQGKSWQQKTSGK